MPVFCRLLAAKSQLCLCAGSVHPYFCRSRARLMPKYPSAYRYRGHTQRRAGGQWLLPAVNPRRLQYVRAKLQLLLADVWLRSVRRSRLRLVQRLGRLQRLRALWRLQGQRLGLGRRILMRREKSKRKIQNTKYKLARSKLPLSVIVAPDSALRAFRPVLDDQARYRLQIAIAALRR